MPVSKNSEQLSESNADNLITAITSRTREHPDIKRGTSVRGTIALKEVLQGFKEIQGGLTRSTIEKAAMIVLPHRIYTKQGDYKSAVAIISDIVREILYDIRFPKKGTEKPHYDKRDGLSKYDLMTALPDLSSPQILEEQELNPAQENNSAIVQSKDNPQEWAGHLVSNDLLRESDVKQSLSTTEAIENLIEALEQKLSLGEITEDKYLREKNKLKEMLRAATHLKSQMSDRELAETVMEFMDAKDEQWNKPLTFSDMYVYYHIKGTRKQEQLSPPKQNEYGLRVVIDYLKDQGMLRTVKTGGGLTLTEKSLYTLLDHLIPKVRRGRASKDMVDYGKTQVSERKQEIRKYNPGDVFRNISIRHTLREIAKQKKNLSDIDRHDFRVFVKKKPRLLPDVVLCIDSSGSMGFRQKLIYARLVAASIARTVLERGGRVGVVTFDDFSRNVMPLTNMRQEIFNYIAGINSGGNTNIGDGIECATQLLLHKPNRNQKYILLITDGLPSAISEKGFAEMIPIKGSDPAEEFAILEIMKASSKGVKTSVIHITDSKEDGALFVKKIAKIGNGQVQRVRSAKDIKAIIG